jgi:hypothetical protein
MSGAAKASADSAVAAQVVYVKLKTDSPTARTGWQAYRKFALQRIEVADFSEDFAKACSLLEGSVVFYALSKEEAVAAATAPDSDKAEQELMVGQRRQVAGDDLVPGSYLLAEGTPTPPPSTTGKCPHSIVFPPVARSSLTWSRCFVSPLVWVLVQGMKPCLINLQLDC